MARITNLLVMIGVVILFSVTIVAQQQQCVSPANVVYYAKNSKVYINDVPIDIKGVNWFGFELPGWTIQGLGSASADSIFSFLQQNGFNALRIPFSADLVLQNRRPTGYINYQLNPDLQGLTSVQIMAALADKAASRGILMLFELHRFDPNSLYPSFWYSIGCITNADGVCVNYTEQVVTNMWISLINVMKSKWNVMGMDLLNEPHEINSTTDGATWGTGNTATDWNLAAIRISNNIYSQTGWTRGLTFVEGIGDTPNSNTCESRNYGFWWGGNLQPARCVPLSGSDNTRYVYSPHVYGPSVYEQPYFKVSSFPSNLPPIWQTDFGYIPGMLDQPVVIGEWGGPVIPGANSTWQEAFINYMINTNLRDTFYWALNPTPSDSDTVGVLNGDWQTGNQPVLNQLRRVQPSPTVITISGSNVCITSYASTPIVQIVSALQVAATATVSNSQSVVGSPIAVGPYRVFNNTDSSYRQLPSGQYENLITGLEASINNNMGAGSSVIMLPKSSSSNQVFSYNPTSKNIVNPSTNLVWDLRGGSTSSGNPVIVYNMNGGSNQQYNLVPISYWTGRPVSSVPYFIINRATGMVLDIAYGNFQAGTYVNLYNMKQYGTNNQNWVFTNSGEIQVATYSNLVLDATQQPGSNRLIIYSPNGGSNQQWRYNRATQQIVNQQAGYVLDTNSNNQVVYNPPSTAASQQWYFLAYSAGSLN